MQYGLLKRFQATLLGAAIGETVGQQISSTSRLATSASKQVCATKSNQSLIPVTRFYAESLITPQRVEQPSDPIFQMPLNTAEAAIALLPVFLFFHEDTRKLRQNVQEVLKVWQTEQPSLPYLLAIAHTIAQALLETLKAPTCIPEIVAVSGIEQGSMLGLAPEAHVSKETLQQVQTLLAQPIGLEDAVASILAVQANSARPSDACVAIALYCFLSTIGDFRLSVLRAAQAAYEAPIVCSLTGAMSGAYNSMIGIPVEWRLSTGDTQQATLHLATQLLAQWSGVHDLKRATSTTLPLVAAPHVIRVGHKS
ncbi:MAG: ADP-ribosylglycohydrolase family protein [Myxacorys californica WJT36-NPBG1]|jgi:hypothetical protein|nr:ADP-ribosylglycohydrolase family protein [Myxacorys californica WJT36-NPBG1]